MIKRRRTIEGIGVALSRPEPPQTQQGKPGDPQLAAVYQCLTEFSHLTSDDCVVDLGSGAGVLAVAIDDVWQPKPFRPRYIAVDLEDSLNNLSVPLAVHNNSQKVIFSEFLNSVAGELSKKIKLVVIRNVFHELDINLTAEVITTLNQSLETGTDIYIQDMVNLPNPERSNAGWDSSCFESFLQNLGFSPTKAELPSRSGIRWFSTRFKTVDQHLSVEDVAAECARQRREQKRLMHAELAELNQDYDREDANADVIYLSVEIASIDGQLGKFEEKYGEFEGIGHPVTIAGRQIYLRPSTEPQIFPSAPETDQAVFNTSGLVATLRDKDDLDIPKLISESDSVVWFSGYSQKLTFMREDNRRAIVEAASKGVTLRFVIVDPNSDAAKLRSRQPVYSSEFQLIEDIRSTINGYTEFVQNDPIAQKAYQEQRLVLCMTEIAPPCSYFVVDSLCYASFYSQRLTGTSAPCLVFAKASEGHSGYYEILKEEFREAFENSNLVSPIDQGAM